MYILSIITIIELWIQTLLFQLWFLDLICGSGFNSETVGRAIHTHTHAHTSIALLAWFNTPIESWVEVCLFLQSSIHHCPLILSPLLYVQLFICLLFISAFTVTDQIVSTVNIEASIINTLSNIEVDCTVDWSNACVSSLEQKCVKNYTLCYRCALKVPKKTHQMWC